MKKLASLFCLLAFCSVSADGQSFQQPLEKVFHYMMPGHAVRHHAVTKSYTDSLLYAYTVWNYNGGLTSNMNYVMEKEGAYVLENITYSYVKDGKVMETGELSSNGDTLEKTVYQYLSTNNTEIHSTYEYFDGTDPELITVETYYGVKNYQISGLDDVNDLFGFSSAICDSLVILEFDEEDTSVMAGYYTFDADGMPATFTMSLEYSGVLMDVIVKFVVENKLPVKATVTISAMGGMMSATVMEATMSYNNDGQMMVSELIPLPNDLMDISKIIPRMKSVNSYLNNKIRCISNYNWVVYDSTHAEYVLSDRNYYTYHASDGSIDTVYNYTNYSGVAAVPSVAAMQVSVYPNPVRDMLVIRGLEEPAEVTVYSMDGRKVRSLMVGADEGHVSMQGLAEGAYILYLRSESAVAIRKIVKK
ncbi:MAG: T9SS type A sorting domain-containing protein [Bacteroidales bacterium]|nr:T9SS type A sorting domain-containing protein [Bacteroidales bacterium]